MAILFLLIGVRCMAQNDTLTLQRCIEVCIENNLSLKNKQEDVRIVQLGLSENRNKLLPVIQAYANFSHNVEPATSVGDGSGISAMLGVDVPYMVSNW